MAPLPDNNTDCVWIDYNDGHNDHSLQIRHSGGAAAVNEALSYGAAFFAALAAQMYLITITGARFRLQGTNVSLPVAWEAAPSYGSGAMPGSLAPRQICFLARSSNGRMARWFVFGCKLETPNDYRFSLGDSTELNNAWAVISNAQTEGNFLSIDGANPTMYNYVDVNFNSYYEAKTRG